MDLRRGSCLFCKNSVIIKQSSSLKVWQTLTFLFSKDVLNHDEFDKIKSDLKICPICFHKLVIVKRIDKNVKPDILDTSNTSCLLCKNEKYLFQISSWPRFNAFIEEMSLTKNNNCVVCSDCFFYLETKQEIKGKLFSSYPQLNMKQRKIKDNRRKWKVKFAPNIKFQSTPLKERNKKTVSKRKSLEDINIGSAPDKFTENKINFDSLKKFKPLKDNVLFKNNRRLKSDIKFSNQIPYVLIDRSDLSIQNKLDDFGSEKIVPPETLDIQTEALNIKNEVSDKLNDEHVLEKRLTVIVVRMDMEKYIKSESKSEDSEARENLEKVNGNTSFIACQDVSLVEFETSLEIKKRKSVSFAEEKNVEIEYFENESNLNFRNRGVIDEQIVETPSKKLNKGILKRDERVDTKNSMQNEVYEITDSEDECLSASKQIPEQNDNENESTAVVEYEETDGSEEKDNVIVKAVKTGLRRQSTVDLDDFKADSKDSEDDESAMEEGSLDKAVFPEDSSNNDINKDQNQDDNSKGVNTEANTYKGERPVIIDLSDEENASNISESSNAAGNEEAKRNKDNDKKSKENKKISKKRRQSTLVSDVSVDESNTIDFEDNEGENNLEAADKQSMEDEQEVENESTQSQIDENESHNKRSQTSVREKPRPLSKKRKANVVDSEITEKEISKNDLIGSQEICPNRSVIEETNNQKRKKYKPKPLSKKKKLLDTSKNIVKKNVSGFALDRDDDDENHSGENKDEENLSDKDLGNDSNTDLGIGVEEDCDNGLDEDKDNGNVSDESFTTAENDTNEIDGNQDIEDTERSENSCQNSEKIDKENGDQSDLATDYCTTNELRPTGSSLDEQKTIAIDVNESDSSEEIHDKNVAAMTNDRDSEEDDSTNKGETEQSGSSPESEVKQLVSKYLDSVDDSNALLKSGGKDVSLKEASDPNFGEVSDEELTEDLVDSGISKKIDSESFNAIEKNDELGISEIDNDNINSMLSHIFSEDLPDDGLLETKNDSKSEDDLADDTTRGVKRKAIDDELDISKEKKKKKVTFCDDVT